jgi:hypothetical protein
MKTKKHLFALAFVLMLLAGCIPSLHPLYTEKDRIRMNKITGVWISEDSSSIYQIKAAPDNQPSYLCTYYEMSDDGEILQRDTSHANFEVNIVRLDDAYFMDFYPGENEELDKMNLLLAIHLIEVHTFARFKLTQDTLFIWRFDPNWLQTLFDQNKIRIAHEKTGDQIVLTASTEELQKFVTKYAHDPEAYIEPEVLIRKRL